MQYAVTILIVSLVGVLVEGNPFNTSEIECPKSCLAIYDPVCGKNGNNYTEFGNECIMRSSNCRLSDVGLNGFIETDLDWCRTEFLENFSGIYKDLKDRKPECYRPCPLIYAPLCISNGDVRGVVNNDCELDFYNCVLEDSTESASDETMSYFRVLKTGTC